MNARSIATGMVCDPAAPTDPTAGERPKKYFSIRRSPTLGVAETVEPGDACRSPRTRRRHIIALSIFITSDDMRDEISLCDRFDIFIADFANANKFPALAEVPTTERAKIALPRPSHGHARYRSLRLARRRCMRGHSRTATGCRRATGPSASAPAISSLVVQHFRSIQGSSQPRCAQPNTRRGSA